MLPWVRATMLIGCVAAAEAAFSQNGEEAAPAVEGANPLSALSLDSLSATRELPLFTPSRSAPVVEEAFVPEPVAEEPEEEVDTVPPPPVLRLIGVVMAGSEQVAIFADDATGEIRRIRPGEQISGWTMHIVDSRSVEFRYEEERYPLVMFAPGSEANIERPPPPEAMPTELDPDGNPLPPEEVPDAGLDPDGNPLPAELPEGVELPEGYDPADPLGSLDDLNDLPEGILEPE